jgi:uncharacterized protein (DUF488 family)
MRVWEALVTELATIGYEGADIDDFIATLRLANIRLLIDVRELPISRRRGFAKSALTAALAGAGIDYLHLRGLGDPKPGREAAREGDLRKFHRIFLKHLSSRAAQSDLETAKSRIVAEHVCLMCYERDPKVCHRSIVADAISGSIGAKVTHLGVIQGAGRKPQRPRKGAGASQSAAACGR